MIPLIVFVFGAFGGEKNSLLWYAIDMAPIWETPFGQKPWYNIAYMCSLASQGHPSQWVNFGLRPRFPENLQHLRWAPVWAPIGLLWVNFGLRLRFLENLQHLKWAPVWAPIGLLWVPAMLLWEFTAFEVGSGVGFSGFRRCFYENLQHLRWAPVCALVGSGDVSMRIYSILRGHRPCERFAGKKKCWWEGAIANLAVIKFGRWEGAMTNLQVKNFAREKVPSQICW